MHGVQSGAARNALQLISNSDASESHPAAVGAAAVGIQEGSTCAPAVHGPLVVLVGAATDGSSLSRVPTIVLRGRRVRDVRCCEGYDML